MSLPEIPTRSNPPTSEDELLTRAAATCGVEMSYHDVWGNLHTTPPDLLKEVLPKLGIRTGSTAEIERSLADYLAQLWRQPLDPTVVVIEGDEAIQIRIPAARKSDSVKLKFEWEHSKAEAAELEHHWFWLPETRDLD